MAFAVLSAGHVLLCAGIITRQGEFWRLVVSSEAHSA